VTVQLLNAIHTAVTDRGKLMTLLTDKRWRLFFTGDDDDVFMTRSLSVTSKTTEQHLIVRSSKSEAEVTIIKDCARGITLLKLTTDGHEALRDFSSTTERFDFIIATCYGRPLSVA